MKKFLCASLVAMMSFVACDDVNPGGDGNAPIEPDEQKVRVEEALRSLMAEFPASKYEELLDSSVEVYEYCSTTFGENEEYDWSEFETVLEERYDRVFSEEYLSPTMTSYTYLLFLSECTGHLTFGTDGVTYEDAENSVAEFTDGDGVVWKAEVTPYGTVSEVYLGEFDAGWYGPAYDPETGMGFDAEHTDYSDVTVEVPEKLIVKVTKNGTDFAVVTLSFDVNISEGGLDIEKDKVAVSAKVEFEGMEIDVKNFSYNASTGKVERSMTFKNDGKLIYSEKVSGNAKVNIDNETYVAGDIEVEVDIMGIMQVRGTCPDVNEIEECFNEDIPFEDCIEKVNKLFDLGVYFDGGNVKQAFVNLEPMSWVDEYDGYVHYYVEYAIEFHDGSRYIFEDYFEDEMNIFEEFDDFIVSYENLIEKYF